MKIRHKLTFAIMATSTSITLGIIIIVVLWQAGQNEEKLQDIFKTQNNFLSREFERFSFERSADLEVAASRLSNVLEEKRYHLARNILSDTKKAYKAYQNLFFIDKNYIRRFDTDQNSEGEYFNHPFFDQAKRNKKTIYEFYHDPYTHREVMSFVHSVTDKKGKFLGVIVANISPESVIEFTRAVVNSSLSKYKKYVEIIRPNGIVFYSNFREVHQDMELVEFIQRHNRTNEKAELIEKGPFYWSVTKLSTSISHSNHDDVYFITKILKTDYNKDFKKLYNYIMILFCVITLALVFVGIAIARSISRPIEEASAVLQKLGEGDFNSFENIKESDDDYGVLILHMKVMAKKLSLLMAERAKKSRMVSLGKMASDVAHEINNPLQVIYGHSMALKRNLSQPVPDKEKAEKSLKSINDTVERINKIIKGLKNLSHDGDMDPFLSCSLETIIENTSVICSEKMKMNNIFLHIEKPEEKIEFDCRPVQISQVLLNLLNNACDAVMNEENRWIKLEISKKESSIIFKVINSGNKIQSQVSEHLFTPFYSTKTVAGSGLGLSISKSIVHSHRGNISVELDNEHTCFVITLPLKQQNSYKDETKAVKVASA